MTFPAEVLEKTMSFMILQSDRQNTFTRGPAKSAANFKENKSQKELVAGIS